MSALGQRIRYEALRSLAYTSIGSSYTIVGTTFANPVRMLKIDNTTGVNLIISFNGSTDQSFIAANSGIILDYASNNELPVGKLDQAIGDGVYVKQESGSPAAGNVYVTVIYASPN